MDIEDLNNKNKIFLSKFNPKNLASKLKKALIETPAEIFIGAGLGIILATGLAYNHEIKRETKIPLGFSEISQIELDAKEKGKTIGSWTRYLTSVNDMTMKVFECWNESHKNPFANQKYVFASELEERIDPTGRTHHYEIAHFLKSVPQEANSALSEIKEFIQIKKEIDPINSLFDKTWDDSHIDSYHPECNEVCTTDADGDSDCHEECHQVYDHTTHIYNYTKRYGEKSSKSLDEFILLHPNLEFKEKILKTSKTNAEGEYVADISRDLPKEKSRLNQGELLQVANTWYYGSTLNTNLPFIFSKMDNLKRNTDEWRSAKNTAHDDSYITFSHFDSGPREFQVVERTLENGRTLSKSIGEIVDSVQYTHDMIPSLERDIKEFIAVMKDKKEGDAKKLSKKIMDTSKKIYSINFKNGFDVKRFRYGMLLMYAGIGCLGGGLVGLGLDYSDNRWGIYNKLFPEK